MEQAGQQKSNGFASVPIRPTASCQATASMLDEARSIYERLCTAAQLFLAELAYSYILLAPIAARQGDEVISKERFRLAMGCLNDPLAAPGRRGGRICWIPEKLGA